MFDILVHPGESVELAEDRNQRLLYDPTNPKPQITTFRFKVSKPGKSELFINFYRERQWLKTIHLKIDVVEHTVILSVVNEAVSKMTLMSSVRRILIGI